MKIRTLSGKRFYCEGEWDFNFDYENTVCTVCAARAPHLDATTLTDLYGKEIHIFLCNACDNACLDDYQFIEGIGWLGRDYKKHEWVVRKNYWG